MNGGGGRRREGGRREKGKRKRVDRLLSSLHARFFGRVGIPIPFLPLRRRLHVVDDDLDAAAAEYYLLVVVGRGREGSIGHPSEWGVGCHGDVLTRRERGRRRKEERGRKITGKQNRPLSSQKNKHRSLSLPNSSRSRGTFSPSSSFLLAFTMRRASKIVRRVLEVEPSPSSASLSSSTLSSIWSIADAAPPLSSFLRRRCLSSVPAAASASSAAPSPAPSKSAAAREALRAKLAAEEGKDFCTRHEKREKAN